MSVELFSVFVVVSIVIFVQFNVAVEVAIEQGILHGTTFTSRKGLDYHAFYSIPFAKPPIGELRFEPPQPPDSWTGIRNATKIPPSCIQKDTMTKFAKIAGIIGQEDCLYLNVFTPAEKSEPLPVMVWVHGGAFIIGSSGMYSPKYFMDHKVIVISFHYRLNVLGFLSTGDHVVPGNMALKDTVAVLKWVQKNIASFGGDPNKVTVFGESAGGIITHYLMFSPLAKGLFHRAISHSCSALLLAAHTPRPLARQIAREYAKLVGCQTTNSKDLIKCLKKVPADQLVLAVGKMFIWQDEPLARFSIVVEPDDVNGAFLTESPWQSEEINKVPWILGINSAEGAFRAIAYVQKKGEKAAILDEQYRRLFPIVFSYGNFLTDNKTIDDTSDKLKKFYFGDKKIGMETVTEFIQIVTDTWFLQPMIDSALRYKETVYFYYYTHRNKKTFNDFFGKFSQKTGPGHGDDLISFFFLENLVPELKEGDDFQVSQRLVKYWVNFASTGNPNDGVQKWAPVSSKNLEYLEIATKTDEMKKQLNKDRYEFLKTLPLVPTFSSKNMPKFTEEF